MVISSIKKTLTAMVSPQVVPIVIKYWTQYVIGLSYLLENGQSIMAMSWWEIFRPNVIWKLIKISLWM